MIKYIHEMCKDNKCVIELCVSPDNVLKISVFGKHTDFIIISADYWDDEKTVKKCIEDVVWRVCHE